MQYIYIDSDNNLPLYTFQRDTTPHSQIKHDENLDY